MPRPAICADAKFTAGYDVVLACSRHGGDPVASHRAIAFAHWFVRTVPADCLDHLLVVSRRHLQGVLVEYLRHYNEVRPHRSLQFAQPVPRPITSTGDKVTRRRRTSPALARRRSMIWRGSSASPHVAERSDMQFGH